MTLFKKIFFELNKNYNLYKISKIFPKDKINPILKYNRKTLKKIDHWIDDDVYDRSIFNYGLPQRVKHLIDNELNEDITYTDAILCLSTFLKKDVNYLELGVSVGKNFFQMANFFKNSNLTGFDIEEINPKLESFFCRGNREEWETEAKSLKKTNSSLTEYFYPPNHNNIKYLSGDIFDEKSWQRLSGNKFNVIFSDAFHSPDAILHEYLMIKKYEILDDDQFILIWDDLGGEMEIAFNQIWSEVCRKYNLNNECKIRVRLNGWIGLNVHEIGIITNCQN